jgi:hypothetical protein
MTDTPAQTLLADRLRFPGLLPREILILRAWLKLHETEYDRYDFNVRVGAGSDPGPGWPEETRRMWTMNTQKRLDMVAYRGQTATIAEIKDRAGASAIGQLLVYRPLYMADHPEYGTPTLLLITNRMSPDLDPIIRESGIIVDLVTDVDFTPLRRHTP